MVLPQDPSTHAYSHRPSRVAGLGEGTSLVRNGDLELTGKTPGFGKTESLVTHRPTQTRAARVSFSIAITRKGGAPRLRDPGETPPSVQFAFFCTRPWKSRKSVKKKEAPDHQKEPRFKDTPVRF